MPGGDIIILFVLASLGLLLVPGPAVLYILATTAQRSRRHGAVAMLGLTTGGLVHLAAALAGVSAILAASAVAFQTLKYLGAAYLVWLAISALRKPAQIDASAEAKEAAAKIVPYGKTYREALLVNLLNPKSAIFFLAFLPQFVQPASFDANTQILIFGLLFLALGVLTDAAYVLAADLIRRWMLRRGPSPLGRYLPPAIYGGLALATALSGESSD